MKKGLEKCHMIWRRESKKLKVMVKMFEWSVKKVLARRVFKIFSGMRTFLVERFTALTFWLLFSQVKSDIKEFLISNVIKSGFEY
ncbi:MULTISPECIES: hypothetical protein [unclassified Empedobacter]|uniref:hypothetical protein n=1 Tax=unclassified Empedobacter TaxID=2643773 RepID=UPI002577ADFC|nr:MULTISPECIES: hypothetical protein [unclassified Empedobacter]MDM1139019.1 hypothetical protein [Empedobacter sp. R132-2]